MNWCSCGRDALRQILRHCWIFFSRNRTLVSYALNDRRWSYELKNSVPKKSAPATAGAHLNIKTCDSEILRRTPPKLMCTHFIVVHVLLSYEFSFVWLKVEMFEVGTWRRKTLQKMKKARTDFSTVAYNGYIYIFGGRNSTGCLNECERYLTFYQNWNSFWFFVSTLILYCLRSSKFLHNLQFVVYFVPDAMSTI